MAVDWSSSGTLATCNPNEIWDGSAPLYSPGIFPDESRQRLEHYFMAKDNGEHSLPSPISDNSSPSQNSMMDISPSIDSMFFPQPGIASPPGFYRMHSQPTSMDRNSDLKRSGDLGYEPTSYFDDNVVVKTERKLSYHQSKRSKNAARQARQPTGTRQRRASQGRRSSSSDESSDEGDVAISRDNHSRHQPSRGRGRMRSNGRLPHNQVERKYREGINSQLEALRQSLPSLQRFPNSIGSEGADEVNANNPPLARPSKATILATATAYIKQIEAEKQRLADENRMLMYSIISPSSLS